MKKSLAHTNVLLVAAALYQLAGCAPLAPNLDASFGNSVKALQAYQTVNPAASENTANPQLDGQAAQETNSRYVKSFNAPAPHQNVFTIGIGGSQ